MKKKTVINYWLIALLTIIIIANIAIIYFKLNLCPKDYVCLPHNTFKKIIKEKESKNKESDEKSFDNILFKIPPPSINIAPTRDVRVLNDQLYPPLTRTDRNTFNSVVVETANRNINIHSRDIGDSYRLVGYITNKDPEGNKDAGGNSWKLMSREKSRNESDFYIIPTNNNYDVKIPLTQEIVVGQRLRDIYSIPKELQFNSPMLNKTTYEFIELPKGDFTDNYN